MSETKGHPNFPDTLRRDFMMLDSDEQRQSLYDPIRREVIRALDKGVEDFETEVRRTKRNLEDGTEVIEEVTVRKPVIRYWMSVQEIVDAVGNSNPELGLTSYNCYYHLHKLRDQGLVEQYPPPTEKDSSKRVRGMYFRTAARFFVPTAIEIPLGLSEDKVLPAEVNARAVDLAQKVKESGVPDAFEYELDIDGMRHWFSITMSLHDDGESIIAVVRDITGTRKAQEALKRSQEILDLALKGADLAPWEWYQKDARMVFTERYAKLLGYTLDEMEAFASDWRKLVHPDDVELIRIKWYEHLTGQTPFYSAEYRLLTKNGDYKWVIDRGSFVEFDSKNNPVRAAGIVRDISWEKLTLEALGQSEEQYQRLVNDSVQGIAILQDGRVIFANPAYAKIVGREIGELIAMNSDGFKQVFHPDDLDNLKRRIEFEKIETGQLPALRFRYIRPDGEVRWVDSYARVIEYEGHPAIQVLEVDITDQHNAEQALKQSEIRYRTLFENIPDAVFMTDKEGKILFCNPIAGEMFGYDPSDMVGMNINELIHPDDRLWVINTFEANVLGSEERYQGLEARGQRKDRSVFYFHATGTALRKNSEHTGFQFLFRDITERVEAERALRAQRDLARMYLKMAGNIFLVLDREGNISLLNRVGRHVLEIPVDEDVVGTSWFEFVPEDERDEVKQLFSDLMKGDPDYIDYSERAVITRKGNKRLVAWRANLLYDENKEIIGLISSGVDITERKQAEEALRESEERYRMLVERSNLGIAITRYPPLQIVYMNQAVQKTMGFSAKEMESFSSKQVNALFHPEDLAMVEEKVKVILEGEVGEYHPSFEYRIIGKDKKVVWIRDAPQKIIYQGEPAILSILIDITGEKAVAALKDEKIRKLMAMMKAAKNGMAVIRDDKFEFANDALLSVLGMELDELVRLRAWSKAPRKQPDGSSSKSKMKDCISKALDGNPQRLEWILRTAYGKDILVDLELSRIEGTDTVLFSIAETFE